MTQLEELQKLQAKKKEFLIPKAPKEGQEQAKVTFTALSVDDLSLLSISEKTPQDQQVSGIIKALAKSLDSTEEAVRKISFEYMNELIDILMEVNNFDDGDKDKMSRVKKMLAKKNGESDIQTKE